MLLAGRFTAPPLGETARLHRPIAPRIGEFPAPVSSVHAFELLLKCVIEALVPLLSEKAAELATPSPVR